MVTVGVDGSSRQADRQGQSAGLVWGCRLSDTESAFIVWTEWWQYYK